MARFYIQVWVGDYPIQGHWLTEETCNFPDHAQARCRDLVDNQGQTARVIDTEDYGKVVYTYSGKHSEY